MKAQRTTVVGAAIVAGITMLLAGCSSSSSPAAANPAATTSSAVIASTTGVTTSSPQVLSASASSALTTAISPPSSSSKEAPSAGAAGLGIVKTKLGEVVVDGHKRTVYYFVLDVAESGKSNCYADCAKAWPPVIATSAAPTATGVTAKLGIITRTDGKKQVTIGGRPVYTFAFDKAPGDTKGEGSEKIWYAVNSAGIQIN